MGLNKLIITDNEFSQISSFIYNHLGIELNEKKKEFVANRLHKLLLDEGYNTVGELFKDVLADRSHRLLSKLANYVSTNYTYFNREKAHFDFFVNTALPNVLNRLKSQNSNDLRIWSAGCSTGEEAYMLAMLLMEYFGDKYLFQNAGVLATDISSYAIEKAKKGIYSNKQVSQLSAGLVQKYFKQIDDKNWVVRDFLKKEITFRKFNLMNKTFPFKKSFHIIFCRNVMLYFNKSTQEELTRKFYSFTEPGGYLFIGHSESLVWGRQMYNYVKPSVYGKEL